MFKCSFCGREFRANANLNRHLNNIHNAPSHYVQDDDPNLYNFIFYMIKNKKNGKCYVGATTQSSIQKRWRKGKGYKFNKEFTADINKYGVENFELIELERKTTTVYEAKRLEEKYIKAYPGGYNKNTCGIKIISPNMAKASVAKCSSIPGYYEKNVDRCINWQKTHPKEVREIVMKRSRAGGLATARPVTCIETGITYPSATQAAAAIGVHQSKITECCQGKRKSYHGQHWIYTEKGN